MPKFKHHGTITIKGFGHAIRFEPGVEKDVPPVLVGAVLRAGAVASDGAAAPAAGQGDAMVSAQDDDLEPGVGVQGAGATEHPISANDHAVYEAFELLVAQNSPDDFGAGNKPHVNSVKALIDFDLDAPSRDALWARYKARGAA